MDLDLEKMLAQAKTIKEDFDKKQNSFKEKEFTASSGGGAVNVVVRGDRRVMKIEVSDEIKDDINMVCDLVKAAINIANESVDQESKDMMSGIAGGMPGMGDLFN